MSLSRVASGQDSDTEYFLKAFIPRCGMWNILDRASDNCWEESIERHCINDMLVTEGWGHAFG
jgi:hypothetical protein